VQSLPNQDDDDIDLPFKLPSLLHSQGISFALSVEGSWQQRNLMFHAGQAVSFGLDKEAAISAITLFPAQILGIDKEVGSLEKGKKASFILSKGDILDMRTSQVEQAFIDGKPIDLNDKQKDLYKKYKEKFQLKN
jgi:imidazolonepropionase-like amidohydrolase